MAAELSRSVGSSRRSWRSHLSRSFRELFPHPTDVFYSKGEREDEEAALRLAALEKLSGSKRELGRQRSVDLEGIDVASNGSLKGDIQIATGLEVIENNERLLHRVRERMDRVGIGMPTIQVRFENLSVEADAYAGKRALPTLLNSTINVLEGLAGWVGMLDNIPFEWAANILSLYTTVIETYI